MHLRLCQDAGRPLLGGRALLRHRSQMVPVAGLPRLSSVRRGAALQGLPRGRRVAWGPVILMGLCARRVKRDFHVHVAFRRTFQRTENFARRGNICW